MDYYKIYAINIFLHVLQEQRVATFNLYCVCLAIQSPTLYAPLPAHFWKATGPSINVQVVPASTVVFPFRSLATTKTL